jgi:hypothetical protein
MNALTRRDIRIYKAFTAFGRGKALFSTRFGAITQVFGGSLAILPSTFI